MGEIVLVVVRAVRDRTFHAFSVFLAIPGLLATRDIVLEMRKKVTEIKFLLFAPLIVEQLRCGPLSRYIDAVSVGTFT